MENSPLTLSLSEYTQRALTTALPPALSLEYLLPTIYGEAGELIEKHAKAHRDSWPSDRLETESAYEYGDVCWATAVALHVLNATQKAEYEARALRLLRSLDGAETTRAPFPREALWRIADRASTIVGEYWAPVDQLADMSAWMESIRPRLIDDLIVLWRLLIDGCVPATGWPIERVLAANLDKLEGRRTRGTIGGSGDQR